MSESLSDLLAKRRAPEPPELAQVRAFVQQATGVVPTLAVSTSAITIHMPSSAAAGALRMHLHELQSQLGTGKRLVIRIGSAG